MLACANSKGSDYTARMRRLISVLAGKICLKHSFHVPWFILIIFWTWKKMLLINVQSFLCFIYWLHYERCQYYFKPVRRGFLIVSSAHQRIRLPIILLKSLDIHLPVIKRWFFQQYKRKGNSRSVIATNWLLWSSIIVPMFFICMIL